MAGAEHVGGRERPQGHFVDLARFHRDVPVEAFAVAHAEDRVVEVEGPTVGEDVYELDREVGVRCVGGDVQDDVDRSDDGERFFERFRRVDEHVGAGLDAALVEGARFVVAHAAEGAAVGRHGRARVVDETVGAVTVAAGIRCEPAVSGGAVRVAATVQVERDGFDSGRRPLVRVPPAVLAHQEVADLGVAVLEPVRLGLRETVEKVPQHLVEAEIGVAEVPFADDQGIRQPVHVAVQAGCDDHVLVLADFFVGGLAYVAVERQVRRNGQVVPGVGPQRRHAEGLVVVVEAALVPGRVVRHAGGELAEDPLWTADRLDQRLDRQVTERLLPVDGRHLRG